MRNRIILFTITILTLIPGIGMSQEITWVKYPTNLDLGTEDQVSHPSVVFDGSKYHLWYVSQSGAQRSINYARSTDGITYEVYPGNPVLQDGVGEVWDREWVSQPSVVYDGTTFRMWYAGYDGNALRIGYATSADGVSWNKDAANPVLDVGASGDFDDEGVSSPGVLHDGDQYHIFYSGYDGANLRIGYATSADGVMWDKSASNPVLDLGPGDDFDNAGVSSPTVLHDETQYHIFYSGYDGANLRIGYATSPDGVSWNKNTSNPVLDLGPGGDWDDEGVSGPSVLYDGTLYRMFYSGYDGDNLKIGYAIGQGVQDLVANAGADDTICSGTCATLNGSASGGSGGYTYLWTPGNMTGQYPEVCPTTTTIYTLTVTDNNGCTAADQVVVTVRECDTTTCSVIANAASDVSICPGPAPV